MVGLLFNLASFSSKKRSVWLVPIFMLLLLIVTRTASMLMDNMYTLYFVYYIGWGLSFVVSIIFMTGSLKSLFTSGHNLKSEVLFYKKLGYTTINQFLMKVFAVVVSTVFLWLLCSFVFWHFSYRVLLIMFIAYTVLLMLRTISVLLKTSLVYYVAVFIFLVSFFYPVYILPNPAYLLKGGVTDVLYYSLVYVLLYLTAGYKFFMSSWRNECIGWMF
jgi:hypothetical protein